MPIQRSIQVYSADELNSTAKEYARHWFRYDYAAGAIADDIEQFKDETLKPILAALGIEAKEILYSGYAVQGDGACFTGTYAYRLGWRKALASVVEGELLESLLEFGESLDDVQANNGPTTCEIVHDGGTYVHNYTISVQAPSDWPGVFHEGDYDAISELDQVFHRLGYWLWKKLSDEDQSLSSDSAVDEGLDDLGYAFDKNGRYIG